MDDNWPATEIERRPVSELVPYARNARTHTKAQIKKIAASIREWGWTNPVLIDDEGTILAGHGRVMAAETLGITEIPCTVAHGWTEAQKRAYVIADNQLALDAGWDTELLRVELGGLVELDFELGLLGFDEKTLDGLLKGDDDKADELSKADDIKPVKDAAITCPGDVWLLGEHRVLCGDSTNELTIRNLMGDELADLIHADPPYGMGKEADGVANDNLRNQKLDDFQMRWLRVALANARDNCSLYIWGNAPDLWRLWYSGGLGELGDLMVRNELVWAKGSGFGMKSEGQHSYSPETERCLFLMRGQQFLGNQNKDDYWEGWEPLRQWMNEQRELAGWTSRDVNRMTNSHMAGHWFSKSQFHPISRDQYEKLALFAGNGAFALSYDELCERFGAIREGGNAYRRELSAQMREGRTYFDNAHDVMTDVWQFGRVAGAERFGHATPKPVSMLGRAIESSCPEDGLVLEPFLGTGSTLIACEILGRRCYGLELMPVYVDVVVRRWQDKTGRAATLERSGATFEEVAQERSLLV